MKKMNKGVALLALLGVVVVAIVAIAAIVSSLGAVVAGSFFMLAGAMSSDPHAWLGAVMLYGYAALVFGGAYWFFGRATVTEGQNEPEVA